MKRILTAAAMVVATLFVAPPAHADLWDDCVSVGEWNNIQNLPRQMSAMENALSVTGHVVWTGNHGQQVVKQYRYCGWGQQAMAVQIAYARNKAGQYMAFDALLFDLRGYPLNHHPFSKDTQWGG